MELSAVYCSPPCLFIVFNIAALGLPSLPNNYALANSDSVAPQKVQLFILEILHSSISIYVCFAFLPCHKNSDTHNTVVSTHQPLTFNMTSSFATSAQTQLDNDFDALAVTSGFFPVDNSSLTEKRRRTRSFHGSRRRLSCDYDSDTIFLRVCVTSLWRACR